MLGAINKEGKYVLPEQAILLLNTKEKENFYSCPTCKEKVILKNGEIKRPYFSHLPSSKCSYYEGESLQHQLAKDLLMYFLNNGYIIKLTLKCHYFIEKLQRYCYLPYITVIQKEDNDEMITEYKPISSFERYDLVIISKKKNGPTIKHIFEIKHTHATESRPEPWYEIEASQILSYSHLLNIHLVEDMVAFLYNSSSFISNSTNITLNKKIIELSCVRNQPDKKKEEDKEERIRICHSCRAKDEDWVSRFPKLEKYNTQNRNSEIEKICIGCASEKYVPVFSKGYRSVCKTCMNHSIQEIKNIAYLKF